MTEPAARRATGRTWPILQWVPGYERRWLRFDVIAGLTVCGILVPEGMAYAQLAGVPPEYAFYAAPLGLLAYAVLGSSALEERLSLELAAAGGASAPTATHGDLRRRRE